MTITVYKDSKSSPAAVTCEVGPPHDCFTGQEQSHWLRSHSEQPALTPDTAHPVGLHSYSKVVSGCLWVGWRGPTISCPLPCSLMTWPVRCLGLSKGKCQRRRTCLNCHRLLFFRSLEAGGLVIAQADLKLTLEPRLAWAHSGPQTTAS